MTRRCRHHKKTGVRLVDFFPARVSLATGPGVFRHVRRRAQSRGGRRSRYRRPRDGYDIAGNRYAISRAIHARVMPNTNGIWIYPERATRPGELYRRVGLGKAPRERIGKPTSQWRRRVAQPDVA